MLFRLAAPEIMRHSKSVFCFSQRKVDTVKKVAFTEGGSGPHPAVSIVCLYLSLLMAALLS